MKQTLFLAISYVGSTASFILAPSSNFKERAGCLHLENWVAEMIDDELHRQTHKKEFEREWMEKNRGAILHHMESDFVNTPEPEVKEFQMYKKDKNLAWKDPERYCADRCISTGNCDIFEDFFELSPREVLSFCEECVLGDTEEDQCDVPDGFYNKPMP